MKKIINIFQYITIAIGIVVIIMFLITRFFGFRPYIVLSGSMEDEIKTGSVAYINQKINVNDIKEGDIIAFRSGASQVTHRVVSINSDNTFTTKGDANKTVDVNNVKFSNYIGKTIFSIPYVGYWLGFFQTKTGYAILMVIVGINIAMLIFSNSEDKNTNKKDDIKNKKNILTNPNN